LHRTRGVEGNPTKPQSTLLFSHLQPQTSTSRPLAPFVPLHPAGSRGAGVPGLCQARSAPRSLEPQTKRGSAALGPSAPGFVLLRQEPLRGRVDTKPPSETPGHTLPSACKCGQSQFKHLWVPRQLFILSQGETPRLCPRPQACPLAPKFMK
jgi:hypothetical protein